VAASDLANAPSGPSIVSWNLTARCDLRCPHCYIDAVGRRRGSRDELDLERCRDVVEQVAELSPGCMLILTGGEPLLRDDLESIAAAAAEGGLFPVVGTNGLGLTEARVRSLLAAGVSGVSVSIDSDQAERHDRFRGLPDAWSATIAGAKTARALGLHLVVQHSLMAFNAGRLPEMAALAEQLGAAVFNVFYLVCTGRGERLTRLDPQQYERSLVELAGLRRIYEGRMIVGARCAPQFARVAVEQAGEGEAAAAGFVGGCPAGTHYLRIAPDGAVTPCPYMPRPVGQLGEHRLSEVWASAPLLARLRDEQPTGRCGQCEFGSICGGCRARALAEVGDLMAEDPICTHEPAPDSDSASVKSQPLTPPGECQVATSDTEGGRYGGEVRAELSWSPEAEAMLAGIPAFVRGRVAKRVEARCREQGITQVTPEVMAELRPRGLPFGRHR
jgi:AdoMet-dependent heme synthase